MKTIIKTSVLIASTFLVSNGFSGSMGQLHAEEPLSWAVNAGVGYGSFHYDGETVLGRLSISREMVKNNNYILGLELGVQQFWSEHGGRTFRFGSTNRRVGGVNRFRGTRVEMNPVVDLLATAQFNLSGFAKTFILAKAGVVYRNWDLRERRNGVNRRIESNQSDLGIEAQLGVGYRVTNNVDVSLAYQGIARANAVNGRTRTTLRSDLPISNAILFGIAYKV